MKVNFALKKGNLIIKLLKIQDCNKKYLNWLSDNKFISPNIKMKNLYHLRKYVLFNIKDKNSILLGVFVGNIHIGNIRLHDFNQKRNEVTFGILIGDKNYQGKNYLSKILNIVEPYIKNRFKIRNILLGVNKNNFYARKSFKNNKFCIVRNNSYKKTFNQILMRKKI